MTTTLTQNFLASYSYKPKKPGIMMILGLVLFLPAGIIKFFNDAYTNEKQLNLVFNHLIKVSLSVTESTIFYYIMFIICTALFLLGIIHLYRAYISQQKILLTDNAILIPNLFLHKISSIFYKDILSLRGTSENHLEIKHAKGKIYLILNYFSQESDFIEMYNLLQKKIIEARPPQNSIN